MRWVWSIIGAVVVLALVLIQRTQDMKTSDALSGVLIIPAAAVIIVLAFYWLVFPWVICVRLKSIDETLKRMEANQTKL